jgi:hypothetical protein
MGTKAQELKLLAEGKGCLGKAADDEPLFILRGQDALSGAIVRHWAEIAHLAGTLNAEKYEEAIHLAKKMDEWEPKKWPD